MYTDVNLQEMCKGAWIYAYTYVDACALLIYSDISFMLVIIKMFMASQSLVIHSSLIYKNEIPVFCIDTKMVFMFICITYTFLCTVLIWKLI